MQRITTSICGVCPWLHHLALARVADVVFGVRPPPVGKKLRELCNSTAFSEEHILHFFLAGADFVMGGPDADYKVRNVFGIAQALGAASRGATILSKDKLELEATKSEVVDKNCEVYAYCIDPCPFDALTLRVYVQRLYKEGG